jgi:hypothetical protein
MNVGCRNGSRSRRHGDLILRMRKGMNVQSFYQVGGNFLSRGCFCRFLHHRDTSGLFDRYQWLSISFSCDVKCPMESRYKGTYLYKVHRDRDFSLRLRMLAASSSRQVHIVLRAVLVFRLYHIDLQRAILPAREQCEVDVHFLIVGKGVIQGFTFPSKVLYVYSCAHYKQA